MTELTLVTLIFGLCSGQNFYSVDQKIACFEKYTNCAVKEGGKILTLKDFKEQCLKKDKK